MLVDCPALPCHTGLDPFGNEFTVCTQQPHISNHNVWIAWKRLANGGVKFKCWCQVHLGARTDLKPQSALNCQTHAPPHPRIAPGCILQNQRRPDLEDMLEFVYSSLLLQVGKLRPPRGVAQGLSELAVKTKARPKPPYPSSVLFCLNHSDSPSRMVDSVSV